MSSRFVLKYHYFRNHKAKNRTRDELRKRNREKFQKKNTNQISKPKPRTFQARQESPEDLENHLKKEKQNLNEIQGKISDLRQHKIDNEKDFQNSSTMEKRVEKLEKMVLETNQVNKIMCVLLYDFFCIQKNI